MSRLTAEEVGAALCQIDRVLIDHLGYVDIVVRLQEAEVSLVVESEMVNSRGICHGGLVYALADHALAYAALSTNQGMVTLSAHVIYHRPAPLGTKLTARAKVVVTNGRVVSGEAHITTEDGELIASVQGVHYRIGEEVIPH